MIPLAHPSPGCPCRGEATHHPHLATLFITNTTTAIGALGSTVPPDCSGKAEPRQWDLEEEAVEGSETPHTVQLVFRIKGNEYLGHLQVLLPQRVCLPSPTCGPTARS